MSSWMITLPQEIKWGDYEIELMAAEKGHILNYRVPRHIKNVNPGDRCYLVWRGKIRGYHIVSGIFFSKKSWVCDTTERVWPPGKYIQRSGQFFKVDGPEIKGFQGVRKYEADDKSDD